MNKVLTTSFISLFIAISPIYASFEYNGEFAANRNSNEAQSYYILLNENTNVTFTLKSNGKQTNEVFVTNIKFTSDEAIHLTSKTGIKSYNVPSTGIYEVSVLSSASLDKVVSYELLVDEESGKKIDASSNTSNEIKTQETNKSLITQNITPQKVDTEKIEEVKQYTTNNSGLSIGAAKIIDSSELENNTNENNTKDVIDETKSEIKTEEISLNTSKEDIKTEIKDNIETQPSIASSELKNNIENTLSAKFDDQIVTKITAEPLNDNNQVKEKEDNDFSELGPDTPAIEPDEADNTYLSKNVKAKPLSYKGKILNTDNIDAYRFLGDKNKCWPQAICYDKENNLWMLDGQLNSIICYNPNGNEKLTFGKKGQNKNELGIPVSIAVYNQYILVGDRQKNCIHIFNKNGNWVNAIQSDPKAGLKISNPSSICIRKDEIWVGDSRTNRVLCFDKNFSFLGSFGSTKESKIESISSISTDGEYIYILEEEGVLKKFGTMGNFLSAFSTDIKYSSGLFVDVNKNIWVTDIEQGKVNCFSNDEGKLLVSINNSIFQKKEKFAPSSISISADAKIAVADTSSKKLKIFEIK